MKELQRALALLEKQDVRMKQRRGSLASLCPTRDEATPLKTLGEEMLCGRFSLAARSFANALVQIQEAQHQNFPDAIFWDMDALVIALIGGKSAAPRSSWDIEKIGKMTVRLYEEFGKRSPLRLRYPHDFLYGYDWARWAARNPSERAQHHPFGETFLRRQLKRSGELFLQVRKHKKRPEPSENPMKALSFAREPAEERLLMEDLGRRGRLPVRAWDPKSEPVWDHHYDLERFDASREMGFKLNPRFAHLA